MVAIRSDLAKCPDSGLLLPKKFVDERVALSRLIEKFVDDAVTKYQGLDFQYFLTFHAKFDKGDPPTFCVDRPKITQSLPPYLSNTLVYWVCNVRGIKKLLWMVKPKMPGEKLSVEFNKDGVAYLQAKGAMPKAS